MKASDVPAQSLGITSMEVRRGWAFGRGPRDLDIRTRLSDSTQGGATQDTLGVGKGKREQALVQGVGVSDNHPTLLDPSMGSDATDPSETPTGQRGRAPVEGRMDTGAPSEAVGKKCRCGDLRLALVMDMRVVRGHARRWRSDTKDKIDMQTRKDPGASFLMDSGGPVLSAWVAEERNRISGQALTEVEERAHADLVRKANQGELEPWGQRKVFSPGRMGTQPKDMVDARWAPKWSKVDGANTVKARLVAEGILVRICAIATWILPAAWVADRRISS